MNRKFFVLIAILVLLVAILPIVALASDGVGGEPDLSGRIDYRLDPLTSAQAENKVTAMDALLNGKAFGRTHEVARGQYVELARLGEDPVWTVLGEFGDFSHNNIAEPDRSVDNTTLWESALAPNDACTYDDDLGGPAVWQFLIDTTTSWYNAQLADGKSPAEIDAYLAQFDVWDRYDWDGDGNFDEPDGYIDHMNFVHAGEGNEAGGGDLGDCAIWSHSWFAYSNLVGIAGPSPEFLVGGVQIGGSSFWLNKYIINPENGGVGVFAHEYAHDLGLPDLYDTSGGENATGFWTVMSSGSWLSQNDYDIGSQPNHLGAWEKFQLGWLNYEVAFAGEKSEHKLGPAEYNTKKAQGLFVVLPPKAVTEVIASPFSGEYFYYSGAGNNLDNFMYKAVTLGAGSSLTAKVNVQIEIDWDYAYLVVSEDGGTTWNSVDTNLSTTTDPNGQNFGFGITGTSPGWVDLTANLSAYTGDVLIGFRYWTDVSAVEPGFMVDDVAITGHPLDDAEADAGWTFDGFRLTTGTESAFYSNYYVVENRQYFGYDAGLANAYNFVGGNWVEHFPYQDGMLVSYWDNSFANNAVRANCNAGRCGGLLLPVDAHPEALYCDDGSVWRNRVQSFDATFTLDPTDEVTLHCHGVASTHPSLPAVSMFDDNNSYYDPANPWGSVIVPITGTQIRIQSINARGGFMQVQVRPAK